MDHGVRKGALTPPADALRNVTLRLQQCLRVTCSTHVGEYTNTVSGSSGFYRVRTRLE